MKKQFVIVASCVAALFQPCQARAVCRVRTSGVASTFVAVPLSVTVGVPVAQVAPYYYSYQATAALSATSDSSDAAIDAIAAKVVAKLRQVEPHIGASAESAALTPPRPRASAAVMLVGQKCAVCHSGAAPKANLSLESISGLDCQTRLKAVRAVLSEKMPKGGPRLSPEEAGRILEELTQVNDP